MKKVESKKFRAFGGISLTDLDKRCNEKQENILIPFIKDGDATMIYSPSGVGKSFYVIGIAVAIAGGGKFLGYEAPKPKKVLYIDGEMSKWQLQTRIRASLDDLNRELVYKNLTIANRELSECLFPDLGNKEHISFIHKEILNSGYDVVIFDNFSTLALNIEDENSAGSFNPTLELIQELKASGVLPILVHHSNKNGGSYRGTTKIEAIFSNIISLEKSNSIDLTAGAGFRVKFTKNRNEYSEFTEPRTVQLVKGDGWNSITTNDDLDEKVYNELVKCKHDSQQQIAEALGIAPSTVSKAKKRLIAKGTLDEKRWKSYLEAGEDEEIENDDF